MAPRTPAVGTKSSFTVLGSQVKAARKKKAEKDKEESVVEDWEEEMRREEEEGAADKKAQERIVGGNEVTAAADRTGDSEAEGAEADGVVAHSGATMVEATDGAKPSAEETGASVEAVGGEAAPASEAEVKASLTEPVASEPAGAVNEAVA